MELLSLSLHGGQDSHVLHPESELVRKGPRRKREFIPEEKKDDLYWEKRRKNNEAAKRSREKRRRNDYVMESHLMALREENTRLSAELLAMKLHFGLVHPVAYAGHQSNQLQHNVRSRDETVTHTRHLSPHWDYHGVGRDSSVITSHQSSPPFLFPAYTLQTLRGFPYLNTSSTAGPGLFTPLVLPRNVLPTYSSCPAPPLLRPIPSRGASDEEKEQQVPGLLPLCGSTTPRKVSSHWNGNISPPRHYMSN